jgi:hypothetical protein
LKIVAPAPALRASGCGAAAPPALQDRQGFVFGASHARLAPFALATLTCAKLGDGCGDDRYRRGRAAETVEQRDARRLQLIVALAVAIHAAHHVAARVLKDEQRLAVGVEQRVQFVPPARARAAAPDILARQEHAADDDAAASGGIIDCTA